MITYPAHSHQSIEPSAGSEIVIHWSDKSRAQRRSIVDLGGTLWAVPEQEHIHWPHNQNERQRLFARLQSSYYPTGVSAQPVDLPASRIEIVSTEPHPLALYVVAEEVIAALAAMGWPSAITVVDIAAIFPDLGAPNWLRKCEDVDFIDFAMDAAGYKFTTNRIGRYHDDWSKTRYIFVRRELSPKERSAAVNELKARVRREAKK